MQVLEIPVQGYGAGVVVVVVVVAAGHGVLRLNAGRDALRKRAMPNSTLSGEANLLIFPNLDSANITLGVVRMMTEALHVGPILLGTALPAHILSPTVTSRGVVNIAALAVVQASHPSE